jgi:hypothetical protein
VAARDHNGDWVVVALIERDNDHYTDTTRYLDDAEVDAVRGMRRQGWTSSTRQPRASIAATTT